MPSDTILKAASATAVLLAATTVALGLTTQPATFGEPTSVRGAAAPAPSYVPPPQVRAVYATSNTALSPTRLATLVTLIEATELNAIVINVNDGAQPVDFDVLAPIVRGLNRRGIHTIARIVCFQNEALVQARPALALKTHSGATWRDGGGHRWVDPSHQDVWAELLTLSQAAARAGFRELNYDYIRFPSDGAVRTARYPSWPGQDERPRAEVIESFAAYLRSRLKPRQPGLILSADIFGHSILVADDTSIGQRFVPLATAFDVIAPMVYPSHYRPGNFGLKNPAAHPYEVVRGTLVAAKEKLAAAGAGSVVLRPWLQDFDLGADYTAAMVRAQVTAVADAGFSSGWMLWNPRNTYSRAALHEPEGAAAGEAPPSSNGT
jgi:hypothetical protein